MLGVSRGQERQERMVEVGDGEFSICAQLCATGGASPAGEADCEGKLRRYREAPLGQLGGRKEEGTV